MNKISVNNPIGFASEPIAEFIFAHGAGANKESEFMQLMMRELLTHNIQVTLFDFPYMLKAAETGRRHPPNKMDILIEDFSTIINQRRQSLPLYIGGKSMGGRVATMLEDYSAVNGVICFGYPFHPIGNPEKLRTAHLYDFDSPLLIVQGERDTFGNCDQVASYHLPTSIKLVFMDKADHSFKPLKSSEYTFAQHMACAAAATKHFIEETL